MTSIELNAAANGFTRRVELTSWTVDLNVWVAPETDLETAFAAICDDTGESLTVNGWLFDVESDTAEQDYADEQRAILADRLANPSPSDISEVRADFANDATIDPERIDDLTAAPFAAARA